MPMESVTSQILTYQDIRNGDAIVDDEYGIGSLFTDSHRKAFLANPFLRDESSPLLYLSRVDGQVGGILMLFPCEMLAGDKIVEVQEGSTLEVAERFRHLAIGVDIMFYPLTCGLRDVILYAGISEMALPIYKKMGFKVLEYPRVMQLRNSRSLLMSKGLTGFPLYCLTFLSNSFLRVWRSLSKLVSCKLGRKYEIREMSIIPEWVDDILRKDTHKYMELHNKKWFEWNLHNRLNNNSRNVQRFFAIFDNNNPIGFFMIKERYRAIAGGKLKDVVVGSIVEWGSFDEKRLDESDIYMMASKVFPDDVDIVEYATSDYRTIRRLKMCGFIPHGFAHIIVNDIKKKYPDISDINNWRVRYGYADVILS